MGDAIKFHYLEFGSTEEKKRYAIVTCTNIDGKIHHRKVVWNFKYLHISMLLPIVKID